MTQVTSIPEGMHTVTPYLSIKGAAEAIEFYQKAFGARELQRHDMPDGRVMHAQLQIGDSIIMLSDEFEEGNCNLASPSTLKNSSVLLHLYVENADIAYERAIKAGAKPTMPLTDTFWGDRYGQVVDPFGHIWAIAMRKEILTEAQMAERAAQFFCC